MEAVGAVDAQPAPTAPWKTLRVFHELPQGIRGRFPAASLKPVVADDPHIRPKHFRGRFPAASLKPS